MPEKKVMIAGIQQYCNGDTGENLKQGLDLLGRAVDRGAKFICFPELFLTKWFPQEVDSGLIERVQEEHDEAVERLRETASEKQVTIIAPVFERDEADILYNTALVIASTGEITGKYRKLHLPDIPSYHEKKYFKPGNLGFPVFEIDGFRFGIQICWDVYFPEGFRILALEGAQAVFCPTASAFQSQARWLHMICAHALANNIYMIRVNRIGKENKQDFYGESFAVDPFGELILEPVGKTDAIALVNLDLSMVEQARESYGFFKDRRPDLYTPLVETGK